MLFISQSKIPVGLKLKYLDFHTILIDKFLVWKSTLNLKTLLELIYILYARTQQNILYSSNSCN